MKKIILGFLMCLTLSINAQEDKFDTLYVNQIFKDVSQNLISSKVLTFDSIKMNDLYTKFENWGLQTFRDYKEVKTGSTNNIISLLYITSSNYFTFQWYVILIAEFKDNKIKISIFDDGNVFKFGTYNGNYRTASTQARLYNIRDKIVFKDNMIIYNPNATGIFNKGHHNYINALSALEYKKYIDTKINDIENFIKNSNSTKVISLKSDW